MGRYRRQKENRLLPITERVRELAALRKLAKRRHRFSSFSRAHFRDYLDLDPLWNPIHALFLERGDYGGDGVRKALQWLTYNPPPHSARTTAERQRLAGRLVPYLRGGTLKDEVSGQSWRTVGDNERWFGDSTQAVKELTRCLRNYTDFEEQNEGTLLGPADAAAVRATLTNQLREKDRWLGIILDDLRSTLVVAILESKYKQPANSSGLYLKRNAPAWATGPAMTPIYEAWFGLRGSNLMPFANKEKCTELLEKVFLGGYVDEWLGRAQLLGCKHYLDKREEALRAMAALAMRWKEPRELESEATPKEKGRSKRGGRNYTWEIAETLALFDEIAPRYKPYSRGDRTSIIKEICRRHPHSSKQINGREVGSPDFDTIRDQLTGAGKIPLPMGEKGG